MLSHEAEYPTQSSAAYFRRVLKCSLMLAFTTPLLYGVIIRTLGLLGIEHDEVSSSSSSSVCNKSCSTRIAGASTSIVRAPILSSFYVNGFP